MATTGPVLAATNALLRDHSHNSNNSTNSSSNNNNNSSSSSNNHNTNNNNNQQRECNSTATSPVIKSIPARRSIAVNVAAANISSSSYSLPSFDRSSRESDDDDNDNNDDRDHTWATAPNTPLVLEEDTLKQLQMMLSSDSPTSSYVGNDAAVPLNSSNSSDNGAMPHHRSRRAYSVTDDNQHTLSAVELCEECADPFSGVPQPCLRRPLTSPLPVPTTTNTANINIPATTPVHIAVLSAKGAAKMAPMLQHVPQRVQSLPTAIHMDSALLGRTHAATLAAAVSSNQHSAELPTSPRLRRSSSLDQVDKLQLDQLHRWIIGFCVVTFDLELGHAMELVYPPFELDPYLKQNISFCSFPDSHAVSLGDTVYSFRVRVGLAQSTASTAALGTSTLTRSQSSGPVKPKLALPDISDHDGFLYGYVLFRQRKDARLRRGYFQKSLVLLSKQQLPGLFLDMVRRVGAAYFNEGRQILEQTCQSIASWPKPSLGKTLILPLLNTKLQVELPARHRVQLLPRSAALNNPEQYLLASIPPAALYTHTREFLNDLWLCWELVLLGEPIMVLAKGTRECADSVLALINLIAPIPYGGDWRPYFTVHDSDFKAYSSRLKTPGSVIVGVTNPFFKDAFDHWPNILRVNQADMPLSTSAPTRTPSPFERPSLKKFGRQGSGSSFDFIPGLTSKRKRVIDKDTALIKEITTLTQQRVSPHLLNDTIRRYFADLTERFLEPLDRYFTTLIPAHSELTTSHAPPTLKSFRQDEFLKFVQEKGTRLKFKTAAFQATACTDFYAQFLRCPNFVQWLQMRSVAAERRLRQTHLRLLTDANLSDWMQHRTEVELVDMLMRVRFHLRSDVSSNEQRPTQEQIEQLRSQADLIVGRLPADLKTMLVPSSP